MNAVVASSQRVLYLDWALTAAASQHFRRLLALASCTMKPPTARVSWNVGHVVQQRHLTTFSEVIGTVTKIPSSSGLG
ncbi:MAG: hypothetical protein WCE82_12015 [Halobacteriota archaeon]